METEPEGKGCCWQIFRYLIILLVLFNALIFALLGAGIATTGVLGIVFAQTRAVVPVYASGIIACVGIGLLLVSLFGLCAACKRSKCGPMFVFIPFLLLFCGIFTTITVYCFFTSDVLDTLEHQHALIESEDEGILQIDVKMRIDLEDLQSGGANFVKDGVIRLWDACSGEVTQTAGSEPVYELTCSGEGYDTLAYSVNRVCFDPDDDDFDSYMSVCYSNDDWFAPADPSLATTLEKLNTPKGFYCACADEIIVRRRAAPAPAPAAPPAAAAAPPSPPTPHPHLDLERHRAGAGYGGKVRRNHQVDLDGPRHRVFHLHHRLLDPLLLLRQIAAAEEEEGKGRVFRGARRHGRNRRADQRIGSPGPASISIAG